MNELKNLVDNFFTDMDSIEKDLEERKRIIEEIDKILNRKEG